MAVITHVASGETHTLSSSTLVGRAPNCSIRLSDQQVSSQHAAIEWNGSSWRLRDLGSRNGTFLDSRRLDAGQPVLIEAGNRVAFGDRSNPFEIVDISPPTASARSDRGEARTAEGGLLILPDDENPQLTIFQDGPWFMEDMNGERKPIEDRARVESGERWWRLELPVVIAPTQDASVGPLLLNDVGLRFRVSSTEEHIEISLTHGRTTIPLQWRAHSYLLLTLARRRIEDSEDSNLAPGEHGWTYAEDLLDMLRTNENQLNVAIYRARRQLALAEVQGCDRSHRATRRLPADTNRR